MLDTNDAVDAFVKNGDSGLFRTCTTVSHTTTCRTSSCVSAAILLCI